MWRYRLNRLNRLNGLKWCLLPSGEKGMAVRLSPMEQRVEAGGAPGLRPDELEFTVSTKADAPRGGFPEACVGWPYSGLTAAPPAGGLNLHSVPERPSIPLDPCPRHAPGGGDKGCSDPGVRPRSIRSRRSQGRRPYEPSVRQDGGSVARGWTWSGRTVRERVGVLKGPGNWGAAILSGAVNPSSSSGLTRGSVSPATADGLPVPTPGSSPRVTRRENEEVHHEGHKGGTKGTEGMCRTRPQCSL